MAPTTRSKSTKKPNPSSNVPSASKSRVQKKSQGKPRIDIANLVHKTNATVKDPINSEKQGRYYAPPVPTSRRVVKNLPLDLPAELRNAVYGYVLGGYSIAMDDQGIAYKISNPRVPIPASERGKPAQLQKKHFLALLFTCRQVYAEAYLIPYATCTLTFPYPDTLVQWTDRRTSQQQGCITSLVFQFERWDQEPRSWGHFNEEEGTWSLQPNLDKPLNLLRGLEKIELQASTINMFPGHRSRLKAAREGIRERYPCVKVAVEICTLFLVPSGVGDGRMRLDEKREMYIDFDE